MAAPRLNGPARQQARAAPAHQPDCVRLVLAAALDALCLLEVEVLRLAYGQLRRAPGRLHHVAIRP
jgi:hypothetical protein